MGPKQRRWEQGGWHIVPGMGRWQWQAALSVWVAVGGAVSAARLLPVPNVVLILADDLGFNEVQFQNGTRGLQTPHLAALAAQGVVLDRYYTAPLCTPSRSSLMTGKYPHHLGTQSNVIFWDTPWAPGRDAVFLPQVLQERCGFGATAAFGKWHLGMFTPDALPTARGFDEFQGFMQGGGSHGTHVAACVDPPPNPVGDLGYVCPGPSPGPGSRPDYRGYDWFDGTRPDFSANGSSSTALITRAATQFIHAHAADPKPFFLYLPYQNVHEPIGCSAGSYARFAGLDLPVQAKLLYCYLWELDEGIGQVMGALKHAGVAARDTVVIFASDNGAPPELGAGGRNWPLRGWKSQVWEGGVRVPAVVHAPGRLPGGVRRSSYVHVVDLMPTIMGLAGPRCAMAGMDGVDAWPVFREGTPTRREFVVNASPLCGSGQIGPPGAAFVSGDMKLVCYCLDVAGVANGTRSGCRPGPWHLGVFPLLFNITADPGETMDLAWAMPEVALGMEARLVADTAASVEPMQWTPPYQGPTYACASCLRHPSGTGPFVPWTEWVP